jgi:hypothetical protein
MDISMATFWWVLAGAAVAVELATGTFYLLMIALGLAAGAIAAHLGLPVAGQTMVAAIVGGGATAVWHWRRSRQPAQPVAAENRDVNLDISDHACTSTPGRPKAPRVCSTVARSGPRDWHPARQPIPAST